MPAAPVREMSLVVCLLVSSPGSAAAQLSPKCAERIDKIDELRKRFPSESPIAAQPGVEGEKRLGEARFLRDETQRLLGGCGLNDKEAERWKAAKAFLEQAKRRCAEWDKELKERAHDQVLQRQLGIDFKSAVAGAGSSFEAMVSLSTGKGPDKLQDYRDLWPTMSRMDKLHEKCAKTFNKLPEDQPQLSPPHERRGAACQLAASWKEVLTAAVDGVHQRHLDRLSRELEGTLALLRKGGALGDDSLDPFLASQPFLEEQQRLAEQAFAAAGKKAPADAFAPLRPLLAQFPEALKASVAAVKWPASFRIKDTALLGPLQEGFAPRGMRVVRLAAASKGWDVKKNDLGIPLSRSRTIVARVQKKGESFCRQYDEFDMVSSFNGKSYERPTPSTGGVAWAASACK